MSKEQSEKRKTQQNDDNSSENKARVSPKKKPGNVGISLPNIWQRIIFKLVGNSDELVLQGKIVKKHKKSYVSKNVIGVLGLHVDDLAMAGDKDFRERAKFAQPLD